MILDKIISFISGAEVSSAAYKPTTEYKGSLPKTTVNMGDKGSDVVAVQSFLNWAIKAGLTVDGICGAKTVAAIKKYQKQYGLTSDGTFGPKSKNKAQALIKADQINAKATEFAWPAGTAEKKYKYPSGAPTAAFKTAWKKYFPKRKINCGCHQYVMLVLKACGYPTMDLSSWAKIISYLKRHFTQVKVNYTQAQLEPGDIRVHKNSSGGYHIWIIAKDKNGKMVRKEANQVGNKRYAHTNTNNSGNTKKHKQDWLFRAK